VAISTNPGVGPDWDLTTLFPSLDSGPFAREVSDLESAISGTEAYFGETGIDTTPSRGLVEATSFEAATGFLNDLIRRMRLVRSYVSALVTTDSKNEPALAKASELDAFSVRIGKLGKSFSGWVGLADCDSLLESEVGRQYEFLISKSKIEAAHQLPQAEEALVSEMEVTGGVAWKKLHSNVTSQIQVSLPMGAETKTMSMSALRTLAHSADRKVRADAQASELEAWKLWEVPLAAALNSVKGETLLLTSKRGWPDPLDAALFNANIDRQTLDAMLEAAKRFLPAFRRYLEAKARALRIPKLAFYDVFAPLPAGKHSWGWQDGERFVEGSFAEYSSKLADFAARAFREKWVDYPPKPGKVDGAYCMGVRCDESRILMNYKASFSSVSTLAHELGHGYHNLCLSDRPELQRTTPMTLAETASIFCETIIRRAAIKIGGPEERLAVLEASLQGSCQVVVDILSRFLFEQSVFAKRKQRELSPGEFCELMLDAQLSTYGDALESFHPYMWAVKPHYYGRSYYNFPYMFGLLFGLGLYAVYQVEPAGFQERYDDLLSSTGLANADVLADRFGINLRDSAFWDASLAQIKADIEAFERLV
jgi:pepF/M3 family oligoendopeptidase